MDRIRSNPVRRLTAAQVVARLTPRQGLKMAEEIARLSFRRALQEEAKLVTPPPRARASLAARKV